MSRSPRFDDRDVVEIAKFWVATKNPFFQKTREKREKPIFGEKQDFGENHGQHVIATP